LYLFFVALNCNKNMYCTSIILIVTFVGVLCGNNQNKGVKTRKQSLSISYRKQNNTFLYIISAQNVMQCRREIYQLLHKIISVLNQLRETLRFLFKIALLKKKNEFPFLGCLYLIEYWDVIIYFSRILTPKPRNFHGNISWTHMENACLANRSIGLLRRFWSQYLSPSFQPFP